MRIDVTVSGEPGPLRDLTVEAPDGSRFADISGPLADAMTLPAETVWSVGDGPLAPQTLVGDSGLCSGAILVAHAVSPGPAPATADHIDVVGGPDAGRSYAIGRGTVTIGRDQHCGVVLTDVDVSRHHAAMTVTESAVRLRDLGSTNGTSVEGRQLTGDDAMLQPGELFRIGSNTLAISAPQEPRASIRANADGTTVVNRPPTWRPSLALTEIEMPVRREQSAVQRVQWIAAVLPAAAGVLLAVVMHSVQFLVFLLLSPVVMVATALSDRLHHRRGRRRAAARYHEQRREAETEISRGLRTERDVRRRMAPDPVTLRSAATGPSVRLWERRRNAGDALTLRLGMTDMPSTLRVRTPTSSEPAGRLTSVPSTVDLRAGSLGVAAPRAVAIPIARWLVAQLAVLHPPSDVEVVLLLSDDAADDWRWTRWLPHVRGRVAVGRAEQTELVAELSRPAEHRGHGAATRTPWAGQWLVLLIDDQSAVGDLPELRSLLGRGPEIGVTALCLEGRPERLPAVCTSTAVTSGEAGTWLAVRTVDAPSPVHVIADQVGADWAESSARAMSRLVDVATDSGVPQRCRLLDVVKMPTPDAAAIAAGWRNSHGRPSTIVGVGSSGEVELDLKRDGPHALVAGMTGSGKSEFLQTLVAGLATRHPPSSISFVLIDYKGGAAFGGCASLPHVAGIVTDLDGRLTARALASLDCELRRREQLLADAEAADIDRYRHRAGSEPLPRLVLVIDEFAALAEELPEFVSGLVSIAQRGRSLGIHLVLATQRPAGIVSPEIRANITLRVALRVADVGESVDVLGSADAAGIDRRTPGRAFIRMDHSCIEVQTAMVNCPPADAGRAVTVAPLDGWRRPVARPPTSPDAPSQLDLLVDAINVAAKCSGSGAVRRPWLAPLPRHLPLPLAGGGAAPLRVPIGLADQPASQSQPPVYLDLDRGGSVLFAGTAGSGRTSALLTIAVSAAARLTPEQLHIHAVDCSGGGLGTPLRQLPHAGTVAGCGDFEVVEALLRHLNADIAVRQQRSAEQPTRRGGTIEDESPPAVLCLIDGWEGFVAAAEDHDGGRSIDVLLTLLRTAASGGVTVVLTGDRSTLLPRLTGVIPTRFLLRLADRGDYALVGIPPRAVPEVMPPGRALRADGAEVQLAQVRSPADVARAAGGASAPLPVGVPGKAPMRLRPLPTTVRRADLGPVPEGLRLGLGGDAAEPVWIELFAAGSQLLVAGPPRSGRTTALHTLLLEALAAGDEVLVAAPPRSHLAAVARQHDLRLIQPRDRSTDLAALEPARRSVLVVDDSEAFADTEPGEALCSLARRPPAHLAIVAAARSDELAMTYRGVAVEARRGRCALLLQPVPIDGELVGARLRRRRAQPVPGRGILVGDMIRSPRSDGAAMSVQVALP